MTKNLLLAGLLVFGFTTAQAQFKAGIKLAPTFAYSTVDGTDFSTDGVSVRFTTGLITEFKFTENYSLVTGVEILHLAANLRYDNPNRQAFTSYEGMELRMVSRDVNLQYVNIPLHFRMTTNEFSGSGIKGYASLGADLGILTRARSEDQLTDVAAGTLRVTREQFNVDEEFFLLRVGLNVGVGVIYNIFDNTDLVVGVNWMNGVLNSMGSDSDQLRRDALPPSDAVPNRPFSHNLTTSAFMLTVGLMF
ncbi:MAG: outer membrane beta-barrel protein [Luteibaculaceae bacterium]